MNNFDVSAEIAYRHERLQRAAMRSRRTDAPGGIRRSWFARRRITAPKAGAPPAPLTQVVPAVGTAGFHAWAAEVGTQFAERGALAVRRQLDAA